MKDLLEAAQLDKPNNKGRPSIWMDVLIALCRSECSDHDLGMLFPTLKKGAKLTLGKAGSKIFKKAVELRALGQLSRQGHKVFEWYSPQIKGGPRTYFCWVVVWPYDEGTVRKWRIRDEIRDALVALGKYPRADDKPPKPQQGSLGLILKDEETDESPGGSVEPGDPVATPSPVIGNEAPAGETVGHGQDGAGDSDEFADQTDGDPDATGDEIIFPPMDSVKPTEGKGLMPCRSKGNSATPSGSHGGARRSKFSDPIGKRGEAIAEKRLREILPPEEAKTIISRVRDAKKPGWDLEYRSGERRLAVEVKSTVCDSLSSIELTANEWRAAESEGVNYRLALVTDVQSTSPRVAFLDDPFKRFTNGEASVVPVVFKFAMRNAEG